MSIESEDNKLFTVQIVIHKNHIAYVRAASQEAAEEFAAENTTMLELIEMDGPQPSEICCENGDYLEGEMI